MATITVKSSTVKSSTVKSSTVKSTDLESSQQVFADEAEVSEFLGQYGIWYRRFEGPELGEEATDEEILAAYDEPISKLKAEGGYVTADVINIVPSLANLEVMLDKFNKEHWHDEDEVRFIIQGRGIFHIHPENAPVFSIEVEAGDMINLPRGTHHWFDLCQDRTIRAIRLFQDVSGWTPHYTGSAAETQHQPLCFGPDYIPTGSDVPAG